MSRRGRALPVGPAREVCALAEASPDREVCGFVREGPPGREVVPVPNVCEEPWRGFRIAPEAVLAILRGAEEPGRGLLALYHSHPSGGAGLSGRDLAELVVDGRPTLPGIDLWVVSLEGGKALELRSYAWGEDGYAEVARLRPPAGY